MKKNIERIELYFEPAKRTERIPERIWDKVVQISVYENGSMDLFLEGYYADREEETWRQE